MVIKQENRAGCSLIPCERAMVPVIFYDGRVGLCACADYEARFIIGDVKHQELSEILSNNQRVMEKESNCPEIILAAGMPRSGSTWLYNAARLLIASKTGKADFSAGWVEDFDALPKAQLMLLKIHNFDESWSKKSSLVFYSFRDIRDALASMKRKFGVMPTFQLAQNIIENDFKWRSVSSYNLRYETMLRMPSAILEDLSKVLAIPCDSETILSRLNLLDYNDSGPKNARYHMTNLLHKKHITDGRQGCWKGFLDESVVREIEQTFRGWFQKNDYSLSIS